MRNVTFLLSFCRLGLLSLAPFLVCSLWNECLRALWKFSCSNVASIGADCAVVACYGMTIKMKIKRFNILMQSF